MSGWVMGGAGPSGRCDRGATLSEAKEDEEEGEGADEDVAEVEDDDVEYVEVFVSCGRAANTSRAHAGHSMGADELE